MNTLIMQKLTELMSFHFTQSEHTSKVMKNYTTSQIMTKEKPTKRPRVPPKSETRESKG